MIHLHNLGLLLSPALQVQSHINVAALHVIFDQAPKQDLHSVAIAREPEIQIEKTMIDALQSERKRQTIFRRGLRRRIARHRIHRPRSCFVLCFAH